MRTFLIYFLLLLSIVAYSQADYILVEAKYLKLINATGNKDLIADNIRNAELVIDSILLLHSEHPGAKQVFSGITLSYYLIEDYRSAYFSALRYLSIFGDDCGMNDSTMINKIAIQSANRIGTNFDTDILLVCGNTTEQKMEKLFKLILSKPKIAEAQILDYVVDYLLAIDSNYDLLSQYLFYRNLGFSNRRISRLLNSQSNFHPSVTLRKMFK